MARISNLGEMVRVDVRIPKATYKRIERMAKREAVPRSVLLRYFIVRGIRASKSGINLAEGG